MNITELAREIGVSRVTIYRKCDKHGINLKADRAGSGGAELTNETEQQIRELFKCNNVTCEGVTDEREMKHNETESVTCNVTCNTGIEAELAAARATIQGLQEQIDLYKQLFTEEREQNKQLREQLEAANAKAIAMIPTAELYRKMFEQEQQRYNEIVALLPPPIERGAKGFFKRLFKGRSSADTGSGREAERGD